MNRPMLITLRALCVFIAGLLVGLHLLSPAPIHAQSASIPPATTPSGTCMSLEALMNLEQLPPALVQGGGRALAGVPIEASLTADDAGDRWIVGGSAAGEFTALVESDLPLTLQLFDGLDRLASATVPAGESETPFEFPRDGLFTLIVQRNDLTNPAQTGTYRLELRGQVATHIALDDPQTAQGTQQWLFYLRNGNGQPNIPLAIQLAGAGSASVRLSSGGAELLAESLTPTEASPALNLATSGYYVLTVEPETNDQPYQVTLASEPLERSAQRAVLSAFAPPRWEQIGVPPVFSVDDGALTTELDGVTLRVAPDILTSVVVAPSIRLGLGGEEHFIRFVQQTTEQVALLDGHLSIRLRNGGEIFVQDYAWRGELEDSTGNFITLVLPSGQSIRLDWSFAQRLLIDETCVGLQGRQGERILAEGTEITARPAASGASFPIEVVGAGGSYRMDVDWNGLDRVVAVDERVQLDFDAYTRTILTDQRSLTLRRSGPEEAPTQTLLAEGSPYIQTDWENIRRIESLGEQTLIDVLDARERIVRRGRVLDTLQTQAGVLGLTWADGSGNLILPAQEDFLQLELPAQPAPYDPAALPGQAGYLPSNQNNTGQECLPLANAFELNCAPNGMANPANGNLSLSVTDLYARGYRLDLTLSRTYNSLNYQLNGPFGFGWNTDYLLDFDIPYDPDQQARWVAADHPYLMGLDLRQAWRGQLILTTASGSRHVFEAARLGAPLRAASLPNWEILARPNTLADPWRLVRADGVIYDFDRAGRLVAISHPHGGRLSIQREAQAPAAVYRIQDDVGRSLLLEFNAEQHIIRSSLYQGDTLLEQNTYRYTDGYLVGVSYADGSEATYRYTEAGQLAEINDPRAPGPAQASYTYAEDSARLQSILLPTEQPTGALPYRQYAYQVGSTEQQTEVTDEWGRTIRWRFSQAGLPQAAFRAVARSEPFIAGAVGDTELVETVFVAAEDAARYDSINYPGYNAILGYTQGWLASITNPNAIISFTATYTDRTLGGEARPALASYSVSGQVQARYTYDEQGRLLSTTNADGITTRVLEFHPRFGLPTQVLVEYPEPEEPAESLTLRYNELGHLIAREGPRGTWRYTWDALGRLTGLSLPLEQEYSLRYTTPESPGGLRATAKLRRSPRRRSPATCYD
ncbi:MAG: RHS repeat protein, partial [Anaerolineae bacterium]|nr:RHS repeat protein [Anaerolineae bacterium]